MMKELTKTKKQHTIQTELPPLPAMDGTGSSIRLFTGGMMKSSRKQLLKFMLLAFVLNLALRTGFVVAAHVAGLRIGPASPSYYSTDGYQDLGQMIAQGYGLRFAPSLQPTVFRAPIYPFLLGCADRLTGGSEWSVLIVNCLFAALGCSIMFALFWYAAGKRAAIITCVLISLHPQLVLYSWHAFTELAQFFFIALFALCMLFMFKTRTTVWAFATGVAFGLEVLAKGWILGFPLLLIPAFLLSCRKNEKRGWGSVLAFCLATAVVLLPWTVRNYVVSGRLIPLTTGGGYQFLVGNRAQHVNVNLANAEYDSLAKRLGFPTRVAGIHSGYIDVSPVADDYFNRKAKEDIIQHPAALAKKIMIGAVRLWYLSPNSRKKSVAAACMSVLLICLWVAGIPKLMRAHVIWVPYGLLMIYAAIVFGAVYSEYRYSLPLSGLMIGFATTSFLLLTNQSVSPADGKENAS